MNRGYNPCMEKFNITRQELSRITNRNPSTILKQCRKGLAPAFDGSLVNVWHPLVQSYIAQACGAVPLEYIQPLPGVPLPKAIPATVTGGPAPKPRAAKKPPKAEPLPAPEELAAAEMGQYADYMAMPLGEILAKYGSVAQFKAMLDAGVKLQQLEEKMLKNEQTRGALVNAALVKTHVIQPFEDAHLKLLKDGAKAAIAAVQDGLALGESAAVMTPKVSRIMGRYLEPAQKQITEHFTEC